MAFSLVNWSDELGQTKQWSALNFNYNARSTENDSPEESVNVFVTSPLPSWTDAGVPHSHLLKFSLLSPSLEFHRDTGCVTRGVPAVPWIHKEEGAPRINWSPSSDGNIFDYSTLMSTNRNCGMCLRQIWTNFGWWPILSLNISRSFIC